MQAHISALIRSKFLSYRDFHTLMYTCAAEFDFLELEVSAAGRRRPTAPTAPELLASPSDSGSLPEDAAAAPQPAAAGAGAGQGKRTRSVFEEEERDPGRLLSGTQGTSAPGEGPPLGASVGKVTGVCFQTGQDVVRFLKEGGRGAAGQG